VLLVVVVLGLLCAWAYMAAVATQTTLLLVHGDPAAGEKCPDDDGHLP